MALGGSLCWIGLINAALHPALALVFVVPCMPDKVLSRPGCCGGSKRGADESTTTAQPVSGTSAHGGEAGSSVHAPSECGSEIGHPVAHDHHAALHAFEHHMKLPIDIGMFFFTLANAGVRFEFVGPLTVAIALSLVAGKIIGVTVLVLLADKVKCAPMNGRIGKPELLSASLGMLRDSFGSVVNGSHTFGRLIKAYGYAQDVKGAWRCWQEMRSRLIRLPLWLKGLKTTQSSKVQGP